MSPPRAWTLEGARALLPDVRSRTARAVAEVDTLLAEHPRSDAAAQGSLDEQVQQRISRWAREMEALGVAVKGPWRVDFDNGNGCYCWHWPEEELLYFHGYEDEGTGRVRIQ